MAKNVIRVPMLYDVTELPDKDAFFAFFDGNSADAVTGNLILVADRDGFCYYKFYAEYPTSFRGVDYFIWNYDRRYISRSDALDYELDELVRFDIHDWTEEEKEEIRRWYNRLRK